MNNVSYFSFFTVQLHYNIDNHHEQKYIFNIALHQQTEDEGRRNDQHTLPHHHRRQERSDFHRHILRPTGVERQEGRDTKRKGQRTIGKFPR